MPPFARRQFPREILALQGRLFQDAEEENSPGLLILPTFSLPTWRLSWLWEKVFVLPALKFFPVFGGGPGKSQSVQVQREKGIYRAQRTTSLRAFPNFPSIFPLSTSLSPGLCPLFSSSFSPQVDSRGFCWTDQVLCAASAGGGEGST